MRLLNVVFGYSSYLFDRSIDCSLLPLVARSSVGDEYLDIYIHRYNWSILISTLTEFPLRNLNTWTSLAKKPHAIFEKHSFLVKSRKSDVKFKLNFKVKFHIRQTKKRNNEIYILEMSSRPSKSSHSHINDHPTDRIHQVNSSTKDAYTFYPVVVIGAGESGICMGARLQQVLGFDQFRIFERRSQLGGTWFASRYPGIACDM